MILSIVGGVVLAVSISPWMLIAVPAVMLAFLAVPIYYTRLYYSYSRAIIKERARNEREGEEGGNFLEV
jgi:uncharacterized membrane protein